MSVEQDHTVVTHVSVDGPVRVTVFEHPTDSTVMIVTFISETTQQIIHEVHVQSDGHELDMINFTGQR